MAGAEDGREGPEPWELLSSEHLADYEMFGVRRDRARSPRNGTEQDFSIVESPEGVTVVAATPEGELVLVEQYRHPLRTVTLELPSGVVDPGESPLEAAARELREETGYEAGGAEHVGTLELNPSWQTTRVHVVVVRDAVRRGGQEPDESEDLRVRRVPAGDVERMAAAGEVRSCVALAALALARWSGSAPGGLRRDGARGYS
ncbi:MAG TPA: NUDIX hydrolase [Longimicrobiaceae bacterium]|nr:NUDIX hydrolase [Longimicrobiaceae bacterium]